MTEYRFVNGPRTGETISIPDDFRWPLRVASPLFGDGATYDVVYWPRDDIARDEIVLATEPQRMSPERVREFFA